MSDSATDDTSRKFAQQQPQQQQQQRQPQQQQHWESDEGAPFHSQQQFHSYNQPFHPNYPQQQMYPYQPNGPFPGSSTNVPFGIPPGGMRRPFDPSAVNSHSNSEQDKQDATNSDSRKNSFAQNNQSQGNNGQQTLSPNSQQQQPQQIPTHLSSLMSIGAQQQHQMQQQQHQPQQLQQQQQQDAQYGEAQYKTELCKNYSRDGYCRYGLKCRFAHGMLDLRVVQRHKKYKTEKCKNFLRDGSCPYGPRCRFIHNQATQDQDELPGLGAVQNVNQVRGLVMNGEVQPLPGSGLIVNHPGHELPVPLQLPVHDANQSFQQPPNQNNSAVSAPASTLIAPTAASSSNNFNSQLKPRANSFNLPNNVGPASNSAPANSSNHSLSPEQQQQQLHSRSLMSNRSPTSGGAPPFQPQPPYSGNNYRNEQEYYHMQQQQPQQPPHHMYQPHPSSQGYHPHYMPIHMSHMGRPHAYDDGNADHTPTADGEYDSQPRPSPNNSQQPHSGTPITSPNRGSISAPPPQPHTLRNDNDPVVTILPNSVSRSPVIGAKANSPYMSKNGTTGGILPGLTLGPHAEVSPHSSSLPDPNGRDRSASAASAGSGSGSAALRSEDDPLVDSTIFRPAKSASHSPPIGSSRSPHSLAAGGASNVMMKSIQLPSAALNSALSSQSSSPPIVARTLADGSGNVHTHSDESHSSLFSSPLIVSTSPSNLAAGITKQVDLLELGPNAFANKEQQ